MTDSYDQSAIDWRRLNSYAARVARETKMAREIIAVPVERWVEREKIGFFGKRKMIRVLELSIESAPGDHWVLDTMTWRMKSPLDRNNTQTQVVDTSYCLQTSGSLVVRYDHFEQSDGPRFAGFRYESAHTVTEFPFKDGDVEHFDFERKRGFDSRTNRDNNPGRRVSHARGVGLSLRLKKLLDAGATEGEARG